MLGQLTGDNRLKNLNAADFGHLEALTSNGRELPADWAQLGGGVPPHPVPAADGSAPVQSGANGLGVMVWTTCSTAGRRLAAR
jgi:hypothetical protein